MNDSEYAIYKTRLPSYLFSLYDVMDLLVLVLRTTRVMCIPTIVIMHCMHVFLRVHAHLHINLQCQYTLAFVRVWCIRLCLISVPTAFGRACTYGAFGAFICVRFVIVCMRA